MQKVDDSSSETDDNNTKLTKTIATKISTILIFFHISEFSNCRLRLRNATVYKESIQYIQDHHPTDASKFCDRSMSNSNFSPLSARLSIFFTMILRKSATCIRI